MNNETLKDLLACLSIQQVNKNAYLLQCADYFDDKELAVLQTLEDVGWVVSSVKKNILQIQAKVQVVYYTDAILAGPIKVKA